MASDADKDHHRRGPKVARWLPERRRLPKCFLPRRMCSCRQCKLQLYQLDAILGGGKDKQVPITPAQMIKQIRTPSPTPAQTWRTSLLWTAASCSGPRVCLRKASSTETMMLHSKHSRKQMKKTVPIVSSLTDLTEVDLKCRSAGREETSSPRETRTWHSKDVRHLAAAKHLLWN